MCILDSIQSREVISFYGIVHTPGSKRGHEDGFTLRVLTLRHGEQAAKVVGDSLRGWRLEAFNLSQHEVVVGGQIRQAEEVVALLGVEGGAGHAAVQHLRNSRKESHLIMSRCRVPG